MRTLLPERNDQPWQIEPQTEMVPGSLDSRLELTVPLKTQKKLDNKAEEFVVNIRQSIWDNTKESKRKTVNIDYSER